MRDRDCVAFLQTALPRLQLRWPGFRKVHRTVCKRLGRRLRELGLHNLDDYTRLLETDPGEWRRLDALCRIPISRFYRDRKVFETLADIVLPQLAQRAAGRAGHEIRCWSAGCASGEEAYGLRIAWAASASAAFPEVRLTILGTDADPVMVRRAEKARYGGGTLKDLPPHCRELAFFRDDDLFCLRPAFRSGVGFRVQDLRREVPEGCFGLILCRNLAFTYFDSELQHEVLKQLDRHLEQGGYLVIGAHERLPASARFHPMLPHLPIFRKGQGPKTSARVDLGQRRSP